ncbi:MAG: DEAD/DEAH box helicase, partial [Cetobacterium sp.]
MEKEKLILKKYFGYDNFRKGQEDIIANILNKKNTLALMPTGGGKSICYQIPALIFEGVTIVVSPLISLMKDQVDALRQNGIEAAFINSSLSNNECEMIFDS